MSALTTRVWHTTQSWRAMLGLDSQRSAAAPRPSLVAAAAAVAAASAAAPPQPTGAAPGAEAAPRVLLGGGTGLDRALDALAKPGGGVAKPTVLAATRADWDTIKTAASGVVAEELESHVRSGDTFVGKQAFLASASEREEELMKQARLKRTQRGGGE